MSSAFWLGVIVVGVVLVAVGNIKYPLARQMEDRTMAAKTVQETIVSELKSNLQKCRKFHSDLKKTPSEFPIDGLETGAWRTVSGGNLILSLSPKIRQGLILTYSLTNKVNDYHHQLLENTVGMSSALSQSKKTKEMLTHNLMLYLQQLENSITQLAQDGLSGIEDSVGQST